MTRRTKRPGYAMVLVMVFIALLLSFYSVAYRSMGAAVRVETARVLCQDRDAGSIVALARGLALLETGSPPADPYSCAVLLGPPAGERSYTVSFASINEKDWSVQAAPTEWPDEPEPMPSTFSQP